MAYNYDPDAKKDDGSCETCFDGVKNGNEVGIDCGTSCLNTCWLIVQGPTTNNLHSVHFIDKNTGWISGQSGALFKTTNGGSSWTDMSQSIDWKMEHIFFLDQSNGWAIASDIDSTYLINTSDGGINWNIILRNGYYYFSDVEFVTASTGYALAQFGTLSSMQGSVVYKTTDGGSSWEMDTMNTAYVSLFAVDANRVWLSGDDGSINYTLDAAVTWNLTSGGTSMILTDIFIYGNTAVAVANQGNVISYSSNGGTGWDTYFVWDVQVYQSVYLTSAKDCWAVGDYPFNFEEGVIMYSNDGGVSWVHQYPETQTVSNRLTDIYFPDPSHGWIVGYNGSIIRRGY